MIKKILTGIFLILQLGTLQAQNPDDDRDRQYVTDQLRLSLYSNANSQSQILEYLSSGDLLLIEQLQGPYALVTTPEGTKGWVKRGFLVSNPTSNLQLAEAQKTLQKLEQEIEKLSNSKVVIDQYEKDMNELSAKMEQLEDEKLAANETATRLQQEMEARDRQQELAEANKLPATTVLLETLHSYWQVIVPILLAIIFLSFLISKLIVESRIKSKFHGIKIW
ncbi:MAG: TIGR04211 family SH3 domain-containing protein [Pseudomonadota bacterium]